MLQKCTLRYDRTPLISIPSQFIKCIKKDLEYNNPTDNQSESRLMQGL